MIFVFVVVGKIEVRHLILERLYFMIKVWAAWNRVCLFGFFFFFLFAVVLFCISFTAPFPHMTHYLLRTRKDTRGWSPEVLVSKYETPEVINLTSYLLFCNLFTSQHPSLCNACKRDSPSSLLSRWWFYRNNSLGHTMGKCVLEMNSKNNHKCDRLYPGIVYQCEAARGQPLNCP